MGHWAMSLDSCRRLQYSAGAIAVEHAVTTDEELSSFGVDQAVVELREAVRLEFDVPCQSQAAVECEPDGRRGDIATIGAAIEARRSWPASAAKPQRRERRGGVDIGRGARSGLIGGDLRREPAASATRIMAP